MSVSPGVLQEFMNRQFALRRVMQANAEARADIVAKIMDEMTRDLLALTGSGTNATGAAVATDAQAEAMLASIDQRLAQALGSARDEYARLAQSEWAELTDRMPGVYQVFGRRTADRLLAARGVFQNDKLGDLYVAGFKKWRADFANVAGDLRGVMESNFSAAQIEGWDQARLARELLQSGRFYAKNLPALTDRGRAIYTMGGNLGEADALTRRARAIVRTESTAIRTRMVVNWSEEAGFDKYVNVNGEPVATECKEANAAGAMTLEEWSGWTASNGRGGLPPRHTNCDSSIMPVPPEITDPESQRIMQEALAATGAIQTATV